MAIIHTIFEMTEKRYQRFINYAFDVCDAVGFLFHRGVRRNAVDEIENRNGSNNNNKYLLDFDTVEDLKERVARFDRGYYEFMQAASDGIIEIRYGTDWPSIGELYIKDMQQDDLEGVICSCSDKLRKYVLSKKGFSNWRCPDLPEDICFFKNGKPWFISCSHEEYAFIETDDVEDIFILDELNILNDDMLFNPESD